MSEPDLSFVHRLVRGEGNAAGTTLLLLHGTGGNEDDLLEVGSTLLPGATLLSPRGKVSENGMPRFFRRLAEGVFDIEDLQRRTHDLADFVADAASAYSLDAGGVVAVGYSNGANIAASTLLLRSEVLAAAILFRPMVPFVPATMPDLTGKSLLVAGALRDSIAPPAESRRLAEMFKGAGATVDVHWHDGGHELGQDDILSARNWIAQWARET